MSGKLVANVRPVSANYGEDVIDDGPLTRPDLETPAQNWNDLKADAAYAARMTPRLMIRVTNAGVTAVVAQVIGPEGVVVGQVTVTRSAAGVVIVDWTNTGVVGSGDSIAVARGHAIAVVVAPHTGTTVTVKTYGVPGATPLLDVDFTLWVS